MMSLYAGVALIVVFCVTATIWEWQQDGTVLTPFTVMAWPYMLVIVMVNLAGIHFSFFPVSLKSILFGVICMVFYLAGGRMVAYFTGNMPQDDSERESVMPSTLDYYAPLFIALAIVSLAAGIFHFYITVNALGGGLLAVVMPEFEQQYGHGFWGHIMQLSRPAFTFLTGYYFVTRKKSVLLLAIVTLVPIVIAQIKIHIITTVMGGIFFGILIGAVRINLKKILLYAFIGLCLFNIVYIITYSQFGLSDTFNARLVKFMVFNFFSYLFGGPIAFSEVFGDPAFPLYSAREIFAVPINFYNSFYGGGEVMNGIIPIFTSISSNFRVWHSANVYTIFGHLYIHLGTYATFIYMWVIGVLMYYIRAASGKHIGISIGYAFMLSMFAISFFDLTLNKLQVYETFILSLLLPVGYQAIRSCGAFSAAVFRSSAADRFVKE